MKFDSYSRFLKSSLYQECVRAEVDGRPLPDPYQIPCSPAPSKHSASSDRSTLSTPKKVPNVALWLYKRDFSFNLTLWTSEYSRLSLCFCSGINRRPESRGQGGHWMKKTGTRVPTRNGEFFSHGPATGALGRAQRRRTSVTSTSVRILQ